MLSGIFIMKPMSSGGSRQTQSALQGSEVPTEFFSSPAISPKVRTLLNQTEGKSELLLLLP